MTEICPDADEYREGDDLGTVELEVIQDLTESKADVREVHRHVDSVTDVSEVDKVAPAIAKVDFVSMTSDLKKEWGMELLK